MFFGGIDSHKKVSDDRHRRQKGRPGPEGRARPIRDGEPSLAALEGYRPLKGVMETGSFWPWIHETLYRPRWAST